MPSASDRPPRHGALVLLAVAALGGCWGDPVYKPREGEKAPLEPTATAAHLPEPQPLPPAPRPSELSELTSLKTLQPDTLRPGDVVSIIVREEPELSALKARVQRDGTVRLPWLGELVFAGRTRAELQALLEDKLRRTFVRRADVLVELHAEESRKAYVVGRVAHPGVFPLPIDRRVTLVQLVALAGGLSTERNNLEADSTAIRLLRVVDGVRRSFRISFDDVVSNGRLEYDVPIEPEDVIVVPPKRELFVFVSVMRPGGFQLPEGTRLSVEEAVSLAGWFSASADRERLTLIRRGANGATSYGVNLLDENQRRSVQVGPDDTLLVTDRVARRVFVIGQVGRAGAFDLDERGLTLVKLIALCGGFTPRADGDGVHLLRQTPEGRKKYRVPVKTMINTGDLENDPVLQPGDLIEVPESVF